MELLVTGKEKVVAVAVPLKIDPQALRIFRIGGLSPSVEDDRGSGDKADEKE